MCGGREGGRRHSSGFWRVMEKVPPEEMELVAVLEEEGEEKWAGKNWPWQWLLCPE